MPHTIRPCAKRSMICVLIGKGVLERRNLAIWVKGKMCMTMTACRQFQRNVIWREGDPCRSPTIHSVCIFMWAFCVAFCYWLLNAPMLSLSTVFSPCPVSTLCCTRLNDSEAWENPQQLLNVSCVAHTQKGYMRRVVTFTDGGWEWETTLTLALLNNESSTKMLGRSDNIITSSTLWTRFTFNKQQAKKSL